MDLPAGGIERDASIAFGIVGIFLELIIFAGVVFYWISQYQISISSLEVTEFYLVPWGRALNKTIPVSQIEQVSMKGKADNVKGPQEVVITTDTDSITLGGD